MLTKTMIPLTYSSWLAITLFGLAAVSCSATSSSSETTEQIIKIDGSSTVYPITTAIAQSYRDTESPQAQIDVSFSGTGDGFEQFCAGETTINNASRPITKAEMDACSDASIRYLELPVAFDALTVVVHPDNDWADEITIAELETIWKAEAQRDITTWQDVRQDWPARPLTLYGPGPASGTYDYFTEVIIGAGGDSRIDYIASEDDELLVQGVSQDENALGYFGYAYYEDNRASLKALAVDSGNGAVAPSRAVVERGQYHPLARPLFIYVNAQAAQENTELQKLVRYYLDNAAEIVPQVGYIPLPQEGYEVAITQFYRGKVGTVFDGEVQPGLTIGELLSKRATF